MARKLHFDLETYSSVDIRTSGAYKYTQSLDFEIMLLAYAFDDDPIKIIDFARGDTWPEDLVEGLKDPAVEKHAHNASFERQSLRQYGFEIPIEEWRCSLVKSAYCGLPLGLDLISKALNLGEKGKLSTGRALIRFFCSPIKPTKVNGGRHRNLPEHDPEKWEEFKQYCVNDVEAERAIGKALSYIDLPEFEQKNYILDQEINDFGVKVDVDFVRNAVKIDDRFSEEIQDRLIEITGVDNPNSPAQLKEWLSEALGKEITTMAKDSVLQLIKETDDEAVLEVLEGRLKLAKSSTKKYVSMLNCACESDQRAHGLFQFYGANRTGRWAGRLIQLQNLPQNHMKDLDAAREIIASGDYDLGTILYDNVSNILSELIRTALIAPEGKSFVVSDFSAIEARVLSWIANEEWRMDVFRTHGKIYEASAAMMFGVPIEEVTKGSELRQRGKTAELALGYQGAIGAMEQMDKKNKISAGDKRMIVTKWRKANPKIVSFWYDVDRVARQCIMTKKTYHLNGLEFSSDGKTFQIKLPSGRSLVYNKPKIGVNRFGNESVIFMGMDQVIKQWTPIETYGGKLVENIVQAISRDILAYSMWRAREEGFKICMHVHDEMVCESDTEIAEAELERLENIMGEDIPWAKGLPLVADGFVTKFYKKD